METREGVKNVYRLWTALLPSDEELQKCALIPLPADLELSLAAVRRRFERERNGQDTVEPAWQAIRNKIFAAELDGRSFLDAWREICPMMEEVLHATDLNCEKDVIEPLLPPVELLAQVLDKCHIRCAEIQPWLSFEATRSYPRGCLEMKTVTEVRWNNDDYFYRVRQALTRRQREDLI